MEAMVLCAGLGERLRPLTNEIPKPSFPVANRPIIWYTLRLLMSWGVNQVMVNAHHLPDILIETVRSSCPEGMSVDFSIEEEILGTGGGLRKVRDWFNEDPFILMNGDILTDMDIAEAVDFHLARNAVSTMILSTDERRKRLGEVKVDKGGRIRSILDRPGSTGTDSVPTFFTGIHVMSRKVFDFIPDRPYSCLIRDCYRRMLEEGEPIFGFIMDSYWRDIGTPSAYIEANIDVLKGAYEPAFGLVLESEEVPLAPLKDPSLVGRGAALGRDIRLGPYAVIGEGAVIGDGCSVRESIVWPHATVPGGSNLVRTVMGRSTVIET